MIIERKILKWHFLFYRTNYRSIGLSLVLFMIAFSSFSQNHKNQTIDLEQKVSVNLKQVDAYTIIKSIEAQTGLNFSYNSKLLKEKINLNYKAEQQSLKAILDELSVILDIEFVLVENQMVIKKKKKTKTEANQKPKIYTISGTIKDKENGESLIGATVLVSGTRIGTITNSYGFFSLSLPEGDYLIEISFIGFTSVIQNIKLNKNIKMSSDLSFNFEVMNDVTVEIDAQEEVLKQSTMSQIKLQAKDLERFPEFAGEVGLIKTMESLPGIKTFGDGSSFFFVRGGNKDQNLILLDEAPIYNPSHLLGFYSVVNPEVAKEIKIYKADMPVRTGDRLSSLTEIQTRDGNMKQFGMTGLVNPFVYRVSLETPIVKERVSLFASYRHSTLNWLFARVAPDLDIHFLDLNFKFKYKINDNNRLYFSYFYGKDNISNISSENLGFGIDWENFASTLRWNHIFNEKLFSNTTIYGSAYNYNLNVNETDAIYWTSSIRNLTLKTDLTYYMRSNHTFEFGYQLNFHAFNPGNINMDEVAKVQELQATQVVFYVQDSYRLGEKWSFDAGFRLPIWNNTGPSTVYQFDQNHELSDTLVIDNNRVFNSFVNFDPRLSLKYLLNDKSALKMSYGIYHQYIHLLSNSAGPFTSLDVWIPSGLNVKPQRSDILALSYNRWLKNGKFELNAETYYKTLSNQIEYADHANMLLNPLVEGELRFGKGKAYGLELMLRKRKGRWKGWLSYTYSKVIMQFDEINQGKAFPAYYDRPHDFTIFLTYQLSERWHFSANWIYTSGSAITTPIGFYTYMDNTLPLYGEKNNDRLPDYHRLDVSLNWQLNKQPKRFKHGIAFSIYNLYNRHNAISLNYNKVRTGDHSFSIPSNVYDQNQMLTTQSHLLGIMPSLTYKFEF